MDANSGKDSQPNRGSAAAWIFQANPDRFDVDEYLEQTPLAETRWLVRQAGRRMRLGDKVFIWRAKGRGASEPGVIASGRIIGKPEVRPDDSRSTRFWRGRAPGPALRVTVEVDRVARGPRSVVQRDWLLADPVLSGLSILHFASKTNFPLDDQQAHRLEALWAHAGMAWSRPEAIGGLWAYHRSAGGSVSKAPGSPVAVAAERIGRSVGGMYNKVMNFRALDPRDARTGLTRYSETDRAVWNEMYDPATESLRAEELENEFTLLWPADTVDPPAFARLERLTKVSVSHRGQSFVADAATRKAIEDRAMTLAIQHYQALTGLVENTSRTQPYDLRCPSQSREIRVEVKGTTGIGSDILLTIGEVENARGGPWRTDLFVVTHIKLQQGPEGPQALGGEPRVLTGWIPRDIDLKPLLFRYRLPGE